MTTTTKHTDQTHQQYVQNIEHRLRALETDFERLEAEADKSIKKPSEQLAEARKTFNEKRRELRTRLAKAESSAGSAWKEMKAGLDAAWTELSESFERARKVLPMKQTASKASAAH